MSSVVPKYRERLPQLDCERLFLTDGGIETTLIFHEGLDLPHFAAFPLLRGEKGTETLRRYFTRHASIARDHNVGFIFESATWRASADWGKKLGYSQEALDAVNRRGIEMLFDLRRELETDTSPMVISGCVGPRGDGYKIELAMSPEEAQAFHSPQARVFAEAGADMMSAMTMTNTNEAMGVVRAAQAVALPVVIGFTVETDGRLPSGERLDEAINTIDESTGEAPAYYMINCAHPSHFNGALEAGAGMGWVERIHALRSNASTCSHAELDEATTLDDGDPDDLAERCRALRSRFRNINVLGGCCGTDHRHIRRICERCVSVSSGHG